MGISSEDYQRMAERVKKTKSRTQKESRFYNLNKMPGPGMKALLEQAPKKSEPLTFAHLDKMVKEIEANECRFCISFLGQIKGGKNNICITRTGHRFPNTKWAKWRDKMVASVKAQLPPEFKTIDFPTNIRLTYWAEDKRRRDMPAIVDAIFHVLEKAGVATDDTLLWVAQSSRHYDKENPGALVEFL